MKTKHNPIGLYLALVICLISGCALNSPVGGEHDGVGGTGIIANKDTDGIGGTGLRDPGDNDGIGGTGAWPTSGDVALYGVITNIDPLVINGYGMLLDDSTEIRVNQKQAQLSDLRIGSVGWVRAGLRDGAIVAHEVSLETALRGVVKNFSLAEGTALVGDTEVRISSRTRGKLADISVGDWIEVAGILNLDAGLDASLIKVDPANRAVINLNRTIGSLPPFANEVSAFAMEAYVRQVGSNISINPGQGFAPSLSWSDKAGTATDRLIKSESPVLIEFSPTGDGAFEINAVHEIDFQHSPQLIIPEYRPPSPSGTLAPGQSLQPMVNQTVPSDQINTGIDGRGAIPNAQPNVGTVPKVSRPLPPVIDAGPTTDIKPVQPDTSLPRIDARPAISGPR